MNDLRGAQLVEKLDRAREQPPLGEEFSKERSVAVLDALGLTIVSASSPGHPTRGARAAGAIF